MNILERLRSLSRIRLGSTLITFAGLLIKVLETPAKLILPQPFQEILSWGGVIFIFVGMVGFLISFETDKESFTRTLHNYVLPQHFASLPVANTQFAYAIRELVDFYTKQHEGGYLPIVEELETEITVEVLPDQTDINRSYNIPAPPLNYSWQWFRFTIKSNWIFRPLALGYETVFDPQDFIIEVVVMSYDTYTDLFGWRNPRREVYFPIASPVYAEQALRNALASVRYLRGGKKGLEYRVSKWSGTGGNARQISDPTMLLLEPLLEGATPTNKRTIIKDIFLGLEKRPSLWEHACEGVFEIYKLKTRQLLPDLVYINLPQEKDCWWKFESVMEYVLPTKVVKGRDILWDQQAYLFLFGRVATARRLSFKKTADAPCTFRKDRPPRLLGYPYIKDPAGVKVRLVEPNSWDVEPGSNFWFPGDVVIFSWYDTLVDELLSSVK